MSNEMGAWGNGVGGFERKCEWRGKREPEKRIAASCHGYSQWRKINRTCCMRCPLALHLRGL